MTDDQTNNPAPRATADPAAGQPSKEARGALAISLGQASLMLMGGVLALLITQYFGKGAGTDAFFTAYGFYVIAVSFAQTLRLTALPRLMADTHGDEDSRLLAATGTLALVAAVPMLVFAGPLGELLANGDPSGIAAQTLRLLWPALALHLLSGVIVPMLTLRAIYTPIGVAFGAASVVSVITLVLLEPELGIKAVSFGLAVSAAVLTVSLVLTLRGTGWRLKWRPFTDVRSVARDARILTVSSASFLVINFGYLICLAVANHETPGSATTYAYGFFAAAFLVACTAIPSAMVRAPRLLNSGGDQGVTPRDVLADFRIALVLLVPSFGLAAVAAAPFANLIAGEFFDDGDAERLVDTLLALAPWVLASVAGILPVLELLNRRRVTALAWIAVAHSFALLPLALAGRLALGTTGIALAQSLAMCVATSVQFGLAFGGKAPGLLRLLGAESVRALAIVVGAFGPAYAVAGLVSEAAGVALAVIGLAACVWALHRWFGRELQLLLSLARLRGSRTRAVE